MTAPAADTAAPSRVALARATERAQGVAAVLARFWRAPAWSPLAASKPTSTAASSPCRSSCT